MLLKPSKITSDINDGKKIKTWCVGKYINLKNIIPSGSVVFDFTVPNVVVPRNVIYVDAGTVKYNPQQTDLNYGLSNDYTDLFACHAGSLVHALEKWEHHELGPIDIDRIDYVIDKALKHGFIF